MRKSFIFILAALIFQPACKKETVTKKVSQPALIRSAAFPTDPPSQKEILACLFEIGSINILTHPSCHNVGTVPSDSTLGQYLSGHLALQTDSAADNWLHVSCSRLDPGLALELWPELNPKDAGQYWSATVIVNHVIEEENVFWHWGVSFLVNRVSGKVAIGSVRCLGGG